MPLIVKDFKWRQTENFVTIQLPLHGIHQSKVHLFTSPKYIKALYEQYFFEAFLWDDIKTSESKCTLTPTEIIFELVKYENSLWTKLEMDISKSEKMELKRKLIEEEHQRFQNECQEKYNRKCELKRVAVREQISLDTKQREHIENVKHDEKSTALGDLEEWREQSVKIVELSSDEEDEVIQTVTPKKPIPLKKTLKSSETSVPLPRQASTLHVDFTERQFPTPSRESKLEEENEWLRKQTEVRRSVGFVSEDLRAEEKNPQYLKSKGEEFLKAGNYLGAISAFSFGIKLSEEFVDLYIGRSQAQFEHGNYYKATQDCSKALDLLKPAISANLNQRVECLSRRGLSLCKMGLFKEGISELEAAVKLQPSNDDLQKMLAEVRENFNTVTNDDTSS